MPSTTASEPNSHSQRRRSMNSTAKKSKPKMQVTNSPLCVAAFFTSTCRYASATRNADLAKQPEHRRQQQHHAGTKSIAAEHPQSAIRAAELHEQQRNHQQLEKRVRGPSSARAALTSAHSIPSSAEQEEQHRQTARRRRQFAAKSAQSSVGMSASSQSDRPGCWSPRSTMATTPPPPWPTRRRCAPAASDRSNRWIESARHRSTRRHWLQPPAAATTGRVARGYDRWRQCRRACVRSPPAASDRPRHATDG